MGHQSPALPERIFAITLPENGVMDDRLLALRALVQAFGGTMEEVHLTAHAADETVGLAVPAVVAHPRQSPLEKEAEAYLIAYRKLQDTAEFLPRRPEHKVGARSFDKHQTKEFAKQGYRSVIGVVSDVSSLRATVSVHEMETPDDAVVVHLDFYDNNFEPYKREVYKVGMVHASVQYFKYDIAEGSVYGKWIPDEKEREAKGISADRIDRLADRLRDMFRARGAYWQRT